MSTSSIKERINNLWIRFKKAAKAVYEYVMKITTKAAEQVLDMIEKDPVKAIKYLAVGTGALKYFDVISMNKRAQARVNAKESERVYRSTHIWDPSTRTYIPIARAMKANEVKAFEDLVRRGYSRVEALDRMHLI